MANPNQTPTPAKRASPFDQPDPAEGNDPFKLDLESLFEPKTGPNPNLPSIDAIKKVAEASHFVSREGIAPAKPAKAQAARSPAAKPAPEAVHRRREYRTGRNVQFNIRASLDVVNGFYDLANEHDWVLGETLEYALNALKRELASGKDPKKK
jgi:hypothetical protein